MSQAVVDPAELRRFAHSLKRFSEDLRVSMAGLHGQMLTLGETWRDQEHAKFIQEFEQTLHVLDHFLEAAGLDQRTGVAATHRHGDLVFTVWNLC